MKKLVTAIALATAASTVMAVDAKPELPNVFDYAGGAVSVNAITGETPTYAEVEFWAGSGNLDVYGFWDVNDDGTHFYKINPTYKIGTSNLYVNYTQKGFLGLDGTSSTDHYAGIGYQLNLETGFIKTSLNLRHTDNGFTNNQSQNGMGILMNGVYKLNPSWQLDGWVDANVAQEAEHSDSEYEIRGNVGIRKTFQNNLYVRVAPHFIHNEEDSDIQMHVQMGIGF